MAVQAARKCLGTPIGPAAQINDIWRTAGSKLLFRVFEQALASAPVRARTIPHAARILPTMGYFA